MHRLHVRCSWRFTVTLVTGFVQVLENLESPGILLMAFSRTGKSLKKVTDPEKFWKFVKVYMTDFFFICSIKSPQCTDKCSKKFFSIANFLPRVLMYQKRQISLPVGYKTARPKPGHWNDCDVISEFQASWKTDFPDIFLFSYKQRFIVPFLSI